MIGVNFLLLLDEQDVPGAILADEMGLGKTAQTVAYLACSRRRKEKGVGGWASVGKKETSALAALVASQKNDTRGFKKGAPVNEPALVVAPASLLENWRRELRTWAPALRVGFFHGKEGQAATRAAAERSGGGGGAFDVLIACYSLFERDSADQKQHRAWLRSMTYSHLVLDEAHLVKNRATQRAKRLDAVAARARRRLLLTGTPLQNNLLELESLIHLVLPGLLKPGALAGDARDGDGEAADVGDGDGDAGLEARRRAARVKTILKPFILRRLKEEVATELIAKKREKRVEEMTEAQATLYETTLEEAREERRRKRRTAAATNGDAVTTKDGVTNPTNDGATNDHASKEDQSSFMTLPANGGTSAVGAKKTRQLFVRLRKIANHPLLVRARYSEADLERIARVCHKSGVFGYEASLDRVRAHVFDDAYSDVDLHNLCGDAATRGQLRDLRLPPEAFSESGKTRALLSLLSDVRAKGSRPLIFSQWKIVLDILEVALRDAGFPFVRLDGATATEERQTICDAYNDADSTAFAFLLSTRAGGQGLNLTSADTVIIHDCDFNPQIDRQAEDRCHRLGQRRPVTVIRLVTRDSVDERIVAVAEKKLDLDAAILSDPKAVAAEENRAVHEIMEELLAG